MAMGIFFIAQHTGFFLDEMVQIEIFYIVPACFISLLFFQSAYQNAQTIFFWLLVAIRPLDKLISKTLLPSN